MNKRLRTTVALFAVLAALMAFVLYSNNAEQAQTPTPTPTLYLWDFDAEDVSKLQVVDFSLQTEVTLARASGEWQVSSSKLATGRLLLPAQPADPGQGEYGASLLSTLFLQRTLTETTQLGQFGLMAPAYEVKVTERDGTFRTFEVGYKTPSGDGYYIRQPGDEHPAIVAANALDPVLGFVANPPLSATPAALDTAEP